jgi:predicted anti-sigma-YlaC factor YlaD
MIQCDTVQEMLSNYIEKSLEPDLRTQIQQHIDSCPACKKLVANVEYLTQRFRRLSSLSVSPQFDQVLRSRIMANTKTETPRISMRNLSYGFSGLAIIAGIYFISSSDIFNSDQSDSESAGKPEIINTQPERRIPVQQNPVAVQPVEQSKDASVSDSLKQRSSDVSDKRIQLVDREIEE